MRIALCGFGAAGRVRLSAITMTPGLSLGGIISRRADVGSIGFAEALADASIEAIAISTENTDHSERVKHCLKAGKHVLCDYPLALNAEEARKLFALAQIHKRLLHTEHVGLLTTTHQKAKEQSTSLGPLQHGTYRFTAGWNEKLADKRRTGPYPILALSRLLQIGDLFGAFTIKQKHAQESPDGFRIALELSFTHGGTMHFEEERRLGMKRSRNLEATLEKGPIHWNSQSIEKGLFAKDLAIFRDRVLHGASCYYDEELMVDILEQLTKP